MNDDNAMEIEQHPAPQARAGRTPLTDREATVLIEALDAAVLELRRLVSMEMYNETKGLLLKAQFQATDLNTLILRKRIPASLKEEAELVFTTSKENLQYLVTAIEDARLQQSEQNCLDSSQLKGLSLPSYNGNPLEWQSFWQSFNNAVHSKPGMMNREKIILLKSALKGKARQVLEGYELTEESYEQALLELKKQFGNPKLVAQTDYRELVAQTYYRQLEVLPHRADAAQQRQTLDAIKKIITNLRTASKNIEQDTIKYKILSKFSRPVVREVCKVIDEDTDKFTVDDLTAALEKIIHIEERVERYLRNIPSITDTSSEAVPTLLSKPPPKKAKRKGTEQKPPCVA